MEPRVAYTNATRVSRHFRVNNRRMSGAEERSSIQHERRSHLCGYNHAKERAIVFQTCTIISRDTVLKNSSAAGDLSATSLEQRGEAQEECFGYGRHFYIMLHLFELSQAFVVGSELVGIVCPPQTKTPQIGVSTLLVGVAVFKYFPYTI